MTATLKPFTLLCIHTYGKNIINHSIVMAPPVATAKLDLTYPLYAADFDPNDSSFLLVGGGGGEGRSGVGNKIV